MKTGFVCLGEWARADEFAAGEVGSDSGFLLMKLDAFYESGFMSFVDLRSGVVLQLDESTRLRKTMFLTATSRVR
jgi:hypothetical protein